MECTQIVNVLGASETRWKWNNLDVYQWESGQTYHGVQSDNFLKMRQGNSQ